MAGRLAGCTAVRPAGAHELAGRTAVEDSLRDIPIAAEAFVELVDKLESDSPTLENLHLGTPGPDKRVLVEALSGDTRSEGLVSRGMGPATGLGAL